MEKKTYFIFSKSELHTSAYYKFQPYKLKQGGWFKKMGALKFGTPIYLLEDMDDWDSNAMAILSRLIEGTHPNGARGFDMCGITYIDENDGRIMIDKLRSFVALLDKGETIAKALEKLGGYNPDEENEWVTNSLKEHGGAPMFLTEDRIMTLDKYTAKLDFDILKNTAKFLADWSEKIFTEYKIITIIGL